VKAGVERTMGGAAYRTFSAPLADVRVAVRSRSRSRDPDHRGRAADRRRARSWRALHREITVELER